MPGLYSHEIQSFLDYLRFEKRYSPNTIISYQTDITSFFFYLDKNYGNLTLQEITHSIIRSWLADLKDNKLTGRSINRKISTLRSFFKYHCKNGFNSKLLYAFCNDANIKILLFRVDGISRSCVTSGSPLEMYKCLMHSARS